MSVPGKKRLLTYNDLVGEYGATKTHWRNRYWAGELKSVGTVGKHLFKREDIEAALVSKP